jgi:tryptophan synthase alpha chain
VLEQYVRTKLEKKEILLMTHIVLGYPSLRDSVEIVRTMVKAGVDLMELQIPFSEPIADGPVILRANYKALEQGATIQGCLDVAKEISHSFNVPFLIMSYYNILFKYGVDHFVSTMAERGLRGAIIPDLPPEEGKAFLNSMNEHNLAPILIFSPRTPIARMRSIATHGRGFIYCVARKGVTGWNTDFSLELARYLSRCRKATHLPLALGFGVKEKADMEFLKGRADIAVIGTQSILIMEKGGISSVGDFIRSLQ